MRSAVSAAIDFGLAALEGGEAVSPPIPAALLAQARLAARNGTSLDTVLRRFAAGSALLGDLVLDEVEAGGVSPDELKCLHRAQGAAFDRLLAAVSDEYTAEQERVRAAGGQDCRAELVERLLAGELVDASELAYNLDSWHLGLVAVGPAAAQAVRGLAATLERSLLIVERDDGTIWAWLGGHRPCALPERQSLFASPSWRPPTSVAIGEPAEGLQGWRLTHRQAAVTLPIAVRSEARLANYAQAPLLASSLQDDLLAASLRQLYLAPLCKERDGGVTARRTLRAYFAADGNVSSAAAALGVNRRTVSSRLATIEDLLGLSLAGASAEIETALRLDEIEGL